MKALWQRLTGKRPQRLSGQGRWFTASLIEANYGAGRMVYGW